MELNQKIGTLYKFNIPMKVHDNDGFNTDPTFIMNKLKQDFESLYNPIDQNEFYDDFYDNILNDEQVY